MLRCTLKGVQHATSTDNTCAQRCTQHLQQMQHLCATLHATSATNATNKHPPMNDIRTINRETVKPFYFGETLGASHMEQLRRAVESNGPHNMRGAVVVAPDRDAEEFPFQVLQGYHDGYTGTHQIYIVKGYDYRNGNKITFAAASGTDHPTVDNYRCYAITSGSAGSTVYIGLEKKNSAGYNPDLSPDSFEIVESGTLPVSSTTHGIALTRWIAQVTYGTGGNIESIRQLDHRGSVVDVAVFPNASNPGNRNQTIEFAPAAGQTYSHPFCTYELQFYKEHDETEFPSDSDRMFHVNKEGNANTKLYWGMFDASYRPSPVQYSLQMIQAGGGTNYMYEIYDFSSPADATPQADAELLMRQVESGAPYVRYWTISQFTTVLTGAGGPWSGTGAPWPSGVGPYWETGGDQATCYGKDIADDSQLTAIDLDNRTLYDTGEDATLDWDSRTIQGGDWTVASGSRFLVNDGTSVTAGGALAVTGGIYCNETIFATTSLQTDGFVYAGTKITSNSQGFYYGSNQVVYARQAAVTSAGAISASTNDADAAKLSDVQGLQAQFNDLLAKIRTHGLIAT